MTSKRKSKSTSYGTGRADPQRVDAPRVDAPRVDPPRVDPPRVEPERVELQSADASMVEVRRSPRRRRTVSAYRDGDRTIVLLPARMSRAEEQRWVTVMLERLEAQERRRAGRASRGDAELVQRAGELSRRYFEGRAQPASVRWVRNQGSRWGSCTPVDGTIRLSDRLRAMPSWVIDYVLVHELAHLFEPGHGSRFQSLVERYPKAERARGYLLGISAVEGQGAPGFEPEADEAEADEAAAHEAEADEPAATNVADAVEASARHVDVREVDVREVDVREADVREVDVRELGDWSRVDDEPSVMALW